VCVAGKIKCLTGSASNFTNGQEYPVAAVQANRGVVTINDNGESEVVVDDGTNFDLLELYVPTRVV
jgi:hypothetical protein